MKNVFTPIWLSLSLIVGLGTFNYTSYRLLRMTIMESPAKVIKSDSILYTSGINLHITDSTKIDSITYNTSFEWRYQRNNSKTEIQFLKNINNNAFVNLHPKVFKWMIFHTAALSLFMASFLFILNLIIQIWMPWKAMLNLKYILTLILSISGIIVFLTVFGKITPKIWNGIQIMDHFNLIFSNPECAIHFFVWPMQAVSFFPIIGILLINLRVYHVFQKEKIQPTHIEYIKLKDTLNIFALYLGLLVSCAVIGTGLQQEMIIGEIPGLKVLYPNEMIYAYGIAFSLTLSLVFIPSYVYLVKASRAFSKADKDEENNSATFLWLHISKETIDNLKLTFSIILPLLTSIIQPFLS